MLMRNLWRGTGAGPGTVAWVGLPAAQAFFLISYPLISELSKQVNWLGPPWGLSVSHRGLAAPGSPRPSLKPGAAGHRPHYKAGESLQDQKARTPSERLRDLDVLRRLDPGLPDCVLP